MKTKLYNVGIIGFGGAGIALYKHFKERNDCVVSAIFDIKETALKRVENINNNLRVFSDIESFLTSNIDIVVVSSPDNTHARYIVEAVKHKKHVICEKPITDSIDSIKDILNCAIKNPDIRIATQHQMRFIPVNQRIKQVVDSKSLGDIFYIEGYYVHNLTERAYKFDNWRKTDNATPLIYSGIHFIDLIRWIIDDDVVEICGMANNIGFPEYPESDFNVVLFKFRSGVIAKVVTAFGAARPQDHSIQIYGNQKCIKDNVLFDKNGRFEIIALPIFGSIKKRNFNWLKDFVSFSSAKLFELLMKIYPNNPQYAISSFPVRLYEHNYAVGCSIDNFIKSIKGEEKLICNVFEATKSAAIAIAGVEAYRTGKTVEIEKYWPKELNDFKHNFNS